MSASYRYPHAYPQHQPSSPFDRLFASSKGAWVAAGIAILYLAYTSALPTILAGLVWNVLVLLTPTTLVRAVDKRRNPTLYDGSNTPQSSSDNYAYKSEAMRRVFGLGSGSIAALPGASSLRRASWLGGLTSPSDAPPGLGNWDNSCYQNSVLQGLSAFQSLTAFLEQSDVINSDDTTTTLGSMRELMAKLNDLSNNGCRIWTPAKLKSMSSWQQQDAQEYFSKIMDDMEKETMKAFKTSPGTAGLQEVNSLDTVKASNPKSGSVNITPDAIDSQRRNPLDGFLAQRVTCTSCGFSEGLSMIPFNCVTVPLGRNNSYQIEDCLNEYTSLEEITGVECARCTLLRTKSQLQHMTAESTDTTDHSVPSSVSLPPELRSVILQRLQAVEQALEEGDVSDDTLNKKCQIPKKARVSSTKTRQAVVARAPQCLVIHVNRSVFDEYTGAQSKNLAEVIYPKVLNLGPWCLGTTQNAGDQEEWRMNPSRSMIGHSGDDARSEYVLRAAVTHYGRHENGHYICYREHPEHIQASESDDQPKHTSMKWWRLSDDDVSAVSENHVLGQGGVFMLFYERVNRSDRTTSAFAPTPVQTVHQEESTANIPIAVELEERNEQQDSTAEGTRATPQGIVEPAPESEVDQAPPLLLPSVRKTSTPQKMRTAGNKSRRRSSGFSSSLQAVAAT
ncbi:cysteine proteinase [Aureobasidium pullulans]|uniref:ubiquitinyl hydrolase 1 n=1 Tax=Aureobasidium pullulans TaxID=5580 RepID=A0A4S9NKY8_AURPU|nr:cysteine proteinase [Aureobasidium pullulans]THY56764.1 cysteine proteinase [Aureobasidium pullulans]